MHVTRLAPSPTGALHLGNARTFLINWLLARSAGWRIRLRIEDLDGPRVKQGADQEAIEDLGWLGLDWDESPAYQSPRMNLYRQAVDRLIHHGHAYPCVCSRSEVDRAASAPHLEDGAAVYPGTCRGRYASVKEATEACGRPPAIRFQLPDRTIEFEDRFCGPRNYRLSELGDFVIAKADGTPAYQLAVVVDDLEMGITDIVRGDDLLDSNPRQIALYHALGQAARIPSYWHLPLVVGSDGRRLAKRHGDTRLSYYRGRGVKPGRILALLARWSGMPSHTQITPGELLKRFDISRLPRTRITFTPEDDRWLLDERL